MCITTYHLEGEGPTSKRVAETLLEIGRRYGSSSTAINGELSLSLNSLKGYIKGVDEEDWQVFLLALSPWKDVGPVSFSPEEQAPFREQMEELMALLPEKPLSVFTLHIGQAQSQEEAESFLKRYSETAERPAKTMGFVSNCLLAAIDDERPLSSPYPLRKEMLLVSFDPLLEEAEREVWALCQDLATVALCEGRLELLLLERAPMLDQMEASEKSTQLRINEILAEIRRPAEQMQPSDLGSILTEVTILFSRLAVAASAMRRDYVKAEGLLRDLRSLFKRWNERSLGNRPTNSVMEVDTYERLVAPFKDFVDRVDALRVQLNTVLDAVRTYLSIQQQSLSLEEQKSSKEQLIRLVNLQELLHKLEILVVAVYMTEMARIVFEALWHEIANLLTALFIPIALLGAIFIGRLLHRE